MCPSACVGSAAGGLGVALWAAPKTHTRLAPTYLLLRPGFEQGKGLVLMPATAFVMHHDTMLILTPLMALA